MALLPWDEVTWLDAVLGLNPTADPRVTTGMFHRDDLDLLKETVWAAGLDPTPESARRWLWRARRRLRYELRDLGWRREDVVSAMLEHYYAKTQPAFRPAPRGAVTSPCRVRRPGGPVDREPGGTRAGSPILDELDARPSPHTRKRAPWHFQCCSIAAARRLPTGVIRSPTPRPQVPRRGQLSAQRGRGASRCRPQPPTPPATRRRVPRSGPPLLLQLRQQLSEVVVDDP